MKKFFLLAVCAMMSVIASAQLITSSRVSVEDKPSNMWLDFGVGTYTGDVEDAGLGLDLGLRWTKMFGSSIGWDIFKINAQTGTSHFTEMLDLQLKTGARYVSPVLFGNSTVFGAVGLGYGYFIDIEEGGFVWEISAGVNLTPRFLVGISYNSHSYSYYSGYDDESLTAGYLSLRLGYNF